MIGHPTTEQIARDCARELLETVLPMVEGDTAAVTVQMLENVLRNIAVRAGHEIAWMTEETAAMERYARAVSAAIPTADEIGPRLDRLAAAPRASLHLDDVLETYTRAGEAFSTALDAALAADDAEFTARAKQMLLIRSEREIEAMADWSPIGR